MDYVLCYKYKKRRGSKPRLSIVSNGSIAASVSGFRGSEAELGEAGLAAVEGEESKLTEEEKAVMRAEFESGLQEAGLHIERDKQVRGGSSAPKHVSQQGCCSFIFDISSPSDNARDKTA